MLRHQRQILEDYLRIFLLPIVILILIVIVILISTAVVPNHPIKIMIKITIKSLVLLPPHDP